MNTSITWHPRKLNIVTNPYTAIRHSYDEFKGSVHRDVVRIADLGASLDRRRSAALYEVGVRENLVGRYLNHLLKTFVIAEIVVFLSFNVAWFVVFDLVSFSKNGVSFLHPTLDIFILTAMLLLLVVAFLSISVTIYYLIKVIRRA